MIKVKKTTKRIDEKTPKKHNLTDIGKKKIIKKKQEKKIDKVKKELKKKPKKEVKKEVKKVVSQPSKKSSVKYFETIGRRKTSQARVRLFTQGDKDMKVNGKPFDVYFITLDLQKIVEAPLEIIKSPDKFGITVQVKGGGIYSQAEAVRHGISRALCLLNPYFKKKLKKAGFLTRDSRMRERKKFGLKRARRAPQWSKR